MSKAAITNTEGKVISLTDEEYRRLMSLARLGYYNRRSVSPQDQYLVKIIHERVV